MASQEDFNELQSETIFTLQTENNDLKQNLHAKVDVIYQELQEIKELIKSIAPPSSLRFNNNAECSSVSSFGSVQEASEYIALNMVVTVHGKGDFPVFKRSSNGKLFTRREDGCFKILSPAQKNQLEDREYRTHNIVSGMNGMQF